MNETENRPIGDIPRIALNAAEAAASIGITKRMLQELVRSGQMACAYAGPQTQVFDPDDLRAWLKANKKAKEKADG